MTGKAPKRAKGVRRRDAARTRASILRVATEEFGRHGFSGARTETIARRARCNIRLVYHHFRRKQGLYLAVIEAAYSQIRQQQEEIDVDLRDPVSSLERLLRFTMDFFERNPNFEGLLQAENLTEGRFARRSLRVPESALRLKNMLRQILDAGEALGVIRPGLEPVQLYVLINTLSRLHRANAYSLSALLGEDLRSAPWRASWEARAVEVLRAFVSPAGSAAASARGRGRPRS